MNTDGGDSGGTLRLVVSERGGSLYVRGFGVGDPDPRDWGETEATPLAQTAAGERAWAFNCRFDFGFMATDIGPTARRGS